VAFPFFFSGTVSSVTEGLRKIILQHRLFFSLLQFVLHNYFVQLSFLCVLLYIYIYIYISYKML
jgi:hypothetical protein